MHGVKELIPSPVARWLGRLRQYAKGHYTHSCKHQRAARVRSL